MVGRLICTRAIPSIFALDTALDERVHPLAAVRRCQVVWCTHTNSRVRETRSAGNSAPVRPEIRLKNEILRAKAQLSLSLRAQAVTADWQGDHSVSDGEKLPIVTLQRATTCGEISRLNDEGSALSAQPDIPRDIRAPADKTRRGDAKCRYIASRRASAPDGY